MNITKLFSLPDKTAIVTGASHGLGVTFAEALASQGANVVLGARSEDKLNDLCRKLTSAGHQAIAVKCDVGDPAQVKAMMQRAMERFGHIDVLVNNAGTVAGAGMIDYQHRFSRRPWRGGQLFACLSGDQGCGG